MAAIFLHLVKPSIIVCRDLDNNLHRARDKIGISLAPRSYRAYIV